jgi:hypothetical protein
MKRGILILLILVVFTLSFVSAEDCTDSDGGSEWMVEGTMTESFGSYTDKCSNSTQKFAYLYTEYYCDEDGNDGTIGADTYYCDSCEEILKCVGQEDVRIESTREDSDNGIDSHVFGEIIDTVSYIENSTGELISFGSEVRYMDTCLDESTLKEYYVSEYDEFLWEEIKCENGCEGGVCLEELEEIKEEASDSKEEILCTENSYCKEYTSRKNAFCNEDGVCRIKSRLGGILGEKIVEIKGAGKGSSAAELDEGMLSRLWSWLIYGS